MSIETASTSDSESYPFECKNWQNKYSIVYRVFANLKPCKQSKAQPNKKTCNDCLSWWLIQENKCTYIDGILHGGIMGTDRACEDFQPTKKTSQRSKRQ